MKANEKPILTGPGRKAGRAHYSPNHPQKGQ